MPSLSASFLKANGPYNLYNVLAGLQTIGVTLKTGSKVAISLPRNVSFLQFTIDGVVAGVFYFTTDSSVSATNLVGTPIPSGDNIKWKGEGNMRSISLPVRYFDIDTDNMVVHFDWE